MLLGLGGQVVWSRRLPGDFIHAQALPNGNVLLRTVDDEDSRPVLDEYDVGGRIVWSSRALRPAIQVHAAERLPNGNTLVIDRDCCRVIEMDLVGRDVIWTHAFGSRSLRSAQRLANGNTLLCFFEGELQEINKTGEVVWARSDLTLTREARALSNGNILLVDFAGNRVVEITRDGEEVWQWASPHVGRVIRALRLPNGRTVVQTEKAGLVAVEARGKSTVWLDSEAIGSSPCPHISLAPAGAEQAGGKG